MNKIKSLHVVITGASSGIGLALTNLYFKNNCKISICARNTSSLLASFEKEARVFIQSIDVSNDLQCQLFIKNAIESNGPIDVLINNAGISMRALVQELEVQVLEQVMAVNFWGAVYCTKAALDSVLQTKGVVCSISSIAGYRGLPARSGYSSSKFALQGFMESLRTELLHTGAHVMWVSPGFTASNIRNVAKNAKGIAQGETPLAEDQLMSAEECASIIFNAIEKRKRTVVMTLQGKVTVWLNRFWPSLADKLVFKHFAKEANSPLSISKK
jgi:short-subunit dehydrogenase